MATTKTNLNLAKAGWAVNLDSDDVSAGVEIKAAPASGNLYLEYVSINTNSAINITIGSGITGGAVDTAIVGPVEFTTSGGQYAMHFTRPIKIDATTELSIDASAGGQMHTYVSGYTEL
tara:strand:+ start:11449 stop:11805 length:357 start_codon:yes stop_codon:yes gene_type:complete